MSFLAYDNRLFGTGVWTDTDSAGTFATSPPIENMGTSQTPGPFAEFEGDTADFQFQAQDASGTAETFTVRLLALIGLDIDDGALISWSGDGGSAIASQTWSQYKNRPKNCYILLAADETHDTVSVSISGAGSGTHRIAAAWASPILSFDQSSGLNYRNQSSATIARVSGTDWPFADVRRRGAEYEFIGTRGETLGVNFDGTEYTDNDFETVMRTIGKYGPVIVSPSNATQTAIDALAVYGVLDSVGNAEQIEGDVMRARFTVLESR